MSLKSKEEFEDYITHTSIKCSYKYIVLYILLRQSEIQKIISLDALQRQFSRYFLIRQENQLQLEINACKPLINNDSSKSLGTPLGILEEKEFISRKTINGEISVDILFNYDSNIEKLLEDSIIHYFVENVNDTLENTSLILKLWKRQILQDRIVGWNVPIEFLTFLVDKFNGISPENEISVWSIAGLDNFYHHFQLPTIEETDFDKDKSVTGYFNPFRGTYVRNQTILYHHYPQNYGCYYGFNQKADCEKNDCPELEKAHPCSKSKGVIWIRDAIEEDISNKKMHLGSDYLQVLFKEVLQSKKNDKILLAEYLYGFKNQIQSFISDFHFSEEELNTLFYDKTNNVQLESEQLPLEPRIKSVEKPNPESNVAFQFSPKSLKIDEETLDLPEIDKLLQLLQKYKQIILYGPPGTGKTYLAQIIAYKFARNNFEIIQFHPSYSYEDFIEGIEAKPGPDQKSVIYEAKPRIFRKLCQYALDHQYEPVVLIIDEINRGDLSRIFGELILGLELGYRNNLEINTPLSDSLGKLKIPANLYIIGTMNSLDRSIAIVDYALRRRFLFYKVNPQQELLRKWLKKNLNEPDDNTFQDQINHLGKLLANPFDTPEISKKEASSEALCGLFEILNSRIKKDKQLGAEYQIGQTYFFIKNIAEFQETWDYFIFPLLEEYLNFDAELLQSYQLYNLISKQ